MAMGPMIRIATAVALSAALAGPVSAAALAGPASAQHRRAPAPVLRWSAPRQIDRGQAILGLTRRPRALSGALAATAAGHGGIPLDGLSCPTVSLCVAVDINGNALVTSTPGRPGHWRRFAIDSAPVDAVSCATARFCATVDDDGAVETSTDPAGGPSAWSKVTIRPEIPFGLTSTPVAFPAISCPSAGLCVTGDGYPREIITTTDPRGGPAAWRDDVGIGRRYSADGLVSASCASTRFCATLSDTGVYTSTAPTGNRSTKLAIDESLEAIACGSRSLCVAVVGGQSSANGIGGLWRSTDPAARHPRWVPVLADLHEQFAVTCVGNSLCVATDSAGQVSMSRRAATAPAVSWQTRRVDGRRVLAGVSCPTVSLCVAIDTDGYAVVGRRT